MTTRFSSARLILALCLLAACGEPSRRGAPRSEGVPAAKVCADETDNPSWDHLEEGWTKLTPPPFPRARALTVWTGEELILWGGDTNLGGTHHADGAAYTPATDSWRTLPPSPLTGRSSKSAVWTGCEFIIWGGYSGEDLSDGAAYNPETDSWRMLPEAPLDERVPVAMVWTGDEVIVWGDMERPEPSSNGAAYDPVTDRWREIAQTPLGLNLAEGVWTGKEMIVFGAKLDNNNSPYTQYAEGAAYDPASNSWRMLPSHRISPQASSVAWTGSELVVWDYVPIAAAYDPTTDSWRDIPDPPFDPLECYPRSAFAERVMFAHFCSQFAFYYPAQERWRQVPWGDRVVAGDPVDAGRVFLFAGATHETTHNFLWAFKPRESSE